jgi:uncharacterized integral membrane protein
MLEVVLPRRLQTAGADVAASDVSGYSGVWNAARYGHKESLAALVFFLCILMQNQNKIQLNINLTKWDAPFVQ